jgi:curved DNA-binding protein CbpA
VPTTTRPDLYAVLGVDASASGDDIARAFRARAKQLHPDTSSAPDAAVRFNELVGAYGVLSNHRTRREYDALRDEPVRPVVPTGVVPGRSAVPVPSKALGSKWSRRKAWTALVCGALVTVLGVGAAWLTWHLHESDAQRRAEFRPVSASRVGNGDIAFIAADGRVVETREPEQHGEGSDLGPTVKVRYDPAQPTHVIVDASSTGRDITLAIVALKFLVGGPVFVVLGTRRVRSLASRNAAPTGAR